MAASDHIHPHQLRLLMRPHEIIAATAGSIESGPHEIPAGNMTTSHLKGKLQESKRPGSAVDQGTAQAHLMGYGAPLTNKESLYESVVREGVQKPIILSPGDTRADAAVGGQSRSQTFWIGNGHHRLASAQAAEAATGRHQYVPVVHDEDYMGSPKTSRYLGIAKD